MFDVPIGLLLGLKHLYGSMDAGAAGIIVKATLSMFIEVRILFLCISSCNFIMICRSCMRQFHILESEMKKQDHFGNKTLTSAGLLWSVI